MAEKLTYELNVNTSQAVTQLQQFTEAVKASADAAKAAIGEIGKKTQEVKVQIKAENADKAKRALKAIETTVKSLSKEGKFYNNLLKQKPGNVAKIKAALEKVLSNTKYINKETGKVNGKYKDVQDKINDCVRALQKMGQASSNSFNKTGIGGFFTKLSAVQVVSNLATNAILKLTNSVGSLVQQGAQLQILSLTLEAFGGSAASAAVALENFRNIAATTSFNLQQVASAGQILLGYGVSIDQATESTRQLAIIASATGGELTNLTRNLGQVQTQGRAYTRDLTQFAIQGIPIWTALSQVIGVSTDEVKKFAADGKIGFAEVQTALDLLTQEGSAFAEIAKRIDQTWIGQLRRLESALQNFALEAVNAFSNIDKALGGPVAGSLKLLTAGFNNLAKNAGIAGAALTSLAIAAGTFFAVMQVAKIVAIVNSLGGLASVLSLIGATLKATLVSLLANPVVLAAVGIAAIAASISFGVCLTVLTELRLNRQLCSLA